MPFYDKNAKKMTITYNFTELSRTPNGPKVVINVSEYSLAYMPMWFRDVLYCITAVISQLSCEIHRHFPLTVELSW